ncbi:LAME_0D07712g1_1 [Lachancea meyersii CBS 8951]|uniref:LAME_0D07712g1_1 n=1 Tax=Lachancea meyersii CBS 8951 TaxID=1266667 RepID=A0A1G4J9V3_9SACH|nr:LAME_0D07712g1_1 [Lachancea meyersii CBS 8951]
MNGGFKSSPLLDESELSKNRQLGSINVDWLTRNSCAHQDQDTPTTAKTQKAESKTDHKAHGKKELTKNGEQDSSSGDLDTSRALSPESRSMTNGTGLDRSSSERRSSVADQNYFDGMACSKSHAQYTGSLLRRSNSLSTNSMGHIEESKPQKQGFLRSLFGRRKKDEPKKEHARRSSISAKSEYGVANKPQHETVTESHDDRKLTARRASQSSSRASLAQPQMSSMTRSKTTPAHPEDADPNLDEFLQRYRLALKTAVAVNSRPTSSHRPIRPDTAKSKATFSIDEGIETVDEAEPKRHLDVKGRPIPSHPYKSSLAPALRKQYRCSRKETLRRTNTNTSSSTNRFGAFLKRVTSHTDEHSSKGSLTDSDTDTSDEESSVGFQSGRRLSIPGLEGIKPLRKVSFATNTYFNDPPQQICSKNPRRGEVEVNPDGSVIIHRLTPEEKREILQKTTSGIVVGGSGHLKLLCDPTVNENDAKRREERKPEAPTANGEETEAVAKNQIKDAEKTAESQADNTSKELENPSAANEEEVSVSKAASEVKIDKPMISRRSGCSLSSAFSTSDDDSTEVYPPPDMKIPHDVTYTRCCHLREILPIPATLKQLKKGSVDPIPLLQLRNPKPSLIEVLSFSDFLSIAPVLCLSLDGVSLSVEMLNIILCSITNKKEFEKLSLRNTPIDHEGWKLLCYFVAECKSLNALDLSMVPGMSINVQKPSKSALKSRVVRMECSLESREELKWDLLTASLATNGGLEEIIISGAKMSLKQFQNFIELGCMQTKRLGLAYNSLTTEQCAVLADWLVQSQVTGLDMAYNDLRGKLGRFSATLIEKMQSNNNVFKYISLNSTNLEVLEGSESSNNDLLRLISSLCYCDNLKLLDISNNPQIFPHVTRHLAHYLPVFVNLMRLQMDYNNIPSTSIVTLAEVFPMCQKLNYVSLRGTKLDRASGCALAATMRKSSSLLTLDLDWEGLSDKIKDKISLCGMRNMESAINRVDDNGTPKLPDALASLQKELSELLTEKPMNKEELGLVTQSFVARLTKARSFIDKMTEDLFKLRVEGNLNTSGKETLIRFCFIDATFERGLRLLAQRYNNKIDIPSHSGMHFDKGGESMRRVESTATLSSNFFAESGHSALLPFQYPPIERSGPAEDAVEIKDDIPGSVDSHARDQLKEEGTILRKTHDILERASGEKSAVSDANHPGHKNVEDSLLDTHDLSDVAKLDGEKIKEFIITQDISTVAGFLQKLRERGVNLNDLFKKRTDSQHTDDSRDPIDSDAEQTSRESSTVVGVRANLQDEKLSQRENDFSDSDTESDVANEGHSIDRVYDEVLDNIERGRFTNH